VYVVIVCPTQLMATMGWTEPLYLHKVEDPRATEDAVTTQCFTSTDLVWKLNRAAVRQWDELLDSTVEALSYVSWKLADVSTN
jgi:hypothetical protein